MNDARFRWWCPVSSLRLRHFRLFLYVNACGSQVNQASLPVLLPVVFLATDWASLVADLVTDSEL